MTRNDWHTKLAWAGLGLGLFLVTLQASQIIPLRMAEGGGFGRALVFFFSYLTILTNLGVALVYFASASRKKALRSLAGPTARAMMAGSIFAVMAAHLAQLLPGWNPQGLARLTDLALHYLTPLVFLFWWLTGPHPVHLRWSRVGVMMIYPLAYAVWVVFRGVTIGRWPYPFVSVPDLGWGQVLVNLALMLVIFALVYLAAVALSRTLNARARYGVLSR